MNEVNETISLLLQIGGPIVAIVAAYWKIDNKVNKLEATHDLRLKRLEQDQDKISSKIDTILEEISEVKVLLAKNGK